MEVLNNTCQILLSHFTEVGNPFWDKLQLDAFHFRRQNSQAAADYFIRKSFIKAHNGFTEKSSIERFGAFVLECTN